MKRGILILVSLFVLFNTPMFANAQQEQKVGEGYTQEGIYYEVFITEELENVVISLDGTSISMTREVRYSGIITPQPEISWREAIDGVYYSGVLILNKVMYTSSETIATYKGVLYEE